MRQHPWKLRRAREAANKPNRAAVQAMHYANLMGAMSGDMPDEKKRRLLAGALDREEITEQQHAELVRKCCA